jgi:hypothetical protein
VDPVTFKAVLIVAMGIGAVMFLVGLLISAAKWIDDDGAE